MASKNKVEVKIHGKEYTVMGAESEEYIQKVALYIDKKMNEISNMSSKLSTSMVAVLAAINVADDYFKDLEVTENLRNEVQNYIRELDNSNSELQKYKQENEELKKEIQKLQIDLAKSQTELKDFINTFDYHNREKTVKIDNTRKIRAK